jgi:aerobic carbon-monoxide dehydrogenase medium subunit
MKPVDFDLHRPSTLDEALELLARHPEEAKLLAGGQSLLPLLNFRLARPEHVVDLGRIASVGEIRRIQDEVVIGSMVRQSHAERSQVVAKQCPLLAAALPNIAHPPIRNRGTIGGSLAHADPAAELPAVATALDVSFVATSLRGTREIPAAQFFRTHLTTALEPDEILTEIRFPCVPAGSGAAFLEVARRRGDFALVGVAVQVSVDGDAITGARICFSGVADTPRRCAEAEDILAGQPFDDARCGAAADAARDVLEPSGDLHASAGYRKDVAGTLLHRAVTEAYDRATSQDSAQRATLRRA